MSSEGGAQEGIVLGQRRFHRGGVAFPAAGTALDIGKQECYRAGRWGRGRCQRSGPGILLRRHTLSPPSRRGPCKVRFSYLHLLSALCGISTVLVDDPTKHISTVHHAVAANSIDWNGTTLFNTLVRPGSDVMLDVVLSTCFRPGVVFMHHRSPLANCRSALDPPAFYAANCAPVTIFQAWNRRSRSAW